MCNKYMHHITPSFRTAFPYTPLVLSLVLIPVSRMWYLSTRLKNDYFDRAYHIGAGYKIHVMAYVEYRVGKAEKCPGHLMTISVLCAQQLSR